jgi:hypothetical protein
MRGALLQRLLALAAVAFLAAVVALAVTRRDSESNSAALPLAAPAPGGGWLKARASPLRAPRKPRATACGFRITAKTLGVTHPVLPCGVQIYIQFGNERVLTRVIGSGSPATSELGLTQALAQKLGLRRTQDVGWRFAVAPD